MAKDNFRLFAPGVQLTESWSTNAYTGTAEALVSAGLARLDQFPGQPGMGKSCVTFYDGERVIRKQCKRDEKYLNIKTAGRLFKLSQGVSKEIQDERDASWKTKLDAKRKAEDMTDVNRLLAEGTLRLLPKTADEYRQKLVKDWDWNARSMRGRMLPSKGSGFDVNNLGATGFSLNESDISKFDDLVSEIRTLLMNVGVRFNAERQKEIISGCKCAVAKGDTRFQRVLASCIE